MENTVTLILDNGDLQVLNAALGELPFKFAAPLIGKINNQIAQQRGIEPPPGPEIPEETETTSEE